MNSLISETNTVLYSARIMAYDDHGSAYLFLCDDPFGYYRPHYWGDAIEQKWFSSMEELQAVMSHNKLDALGDKFTIRRDTIQILRRDILDQVSIQNTI